MCAERIGCLKFPSYPTSVILFTWLWFLKYVHLTIRYIIPLTQICNQSLSRLLSYLWVFTHLKQFLDVGTPEVSKFDLCYIITLVNCSHIKCPNGRSL